MSDETNPVSGAAGGESGAQPGVEPQKPEGSETKQISQKEFQHVLNDALRYKRESQETKKQMEDLKLQMNRLESERLAKEKNFEELYNRSKSELDDWKTKASNAEAYIVNECRMNAVRDAARKLGIREEAIEDLELLDLADVVQVEKTSHGRLIAHGAEQAIEDVKRKKPYLFRSNDLPNFNAGGGKVQTITEEKLTPKKLLELERQYKREGKTDKIKELYAQYRKQSNSASA